MEQQVLHEMTNAELFEVAVQAKFIVNKWLDVLAPMDSLILKLQTFDPSYLTNKYYTILYSAFQCKPWVYSHWFGAQDMKIMYETAVANLVKLQDCILEMKAEMIEAKINPRNGSTNITTNPVIRNIIEAKHKFVKEASLEAARIKLLDAAEASRITAKLAYKAMEASEKAEDFATKVIELADRAREVITRASDGAKRGGSIGNRTIEAANRAEELVIRAINVSERAEQTVIWAERRANKVVEASIRAQEIAVRAGNLANNAQAVVRGLEAEFQAIRDTRLQEQQAASDAAFEATLRIHEAAREQTRQVAQRMANAAIEAAKRAGKTGYNGSDSQ